ncbi:hypothetical protein KR767_02745 [Luteibacter anthropi]|uniref:Uncharacterized protein n=1 Tax=Luteibacter anthropi TaxID=564369 RepID=A0A7X5UE76_9GAMM|nr:hypothetical protein [Luteibacter anthropi]NII08612.1 hypothetical protein [Luteibacter anthropi]URX63006.1 hypothetical protein KR767_02745 [Luteibacter anthropi]
MNELDYLRQMRSLNRPVAPQRDLWAGIEARLDEGRPAAAVTPRQRRTRPWLMAAAIAGVAVLGGGIGLHLVAPTSLDDMAVGPAWKPADPRLAGAAIQLDATRMELNQAMREAPDSAALQRLMLRTERQRERLRNFDKQAG